MNAAALLDAVRAINHAKDVDALLEALKKACNALSKEGQAPLPAGVPEFDDALAKLKPVSLRIDGKAALELAAAESRILEKYLGDAQLAADVASTIQAHLQNSDDVERSQPVGEAVQTAIEELRKRVCLLAELKPIFTKRDFGILGKIAGRVADGMMCLVGVGADAAAFLAAVGSSSGTAVIGALGLAYASVKGGLDGVTRDIAAIDSMIEEMDLEHRVSSENLRRVRAHFTKLQSKDPGQPGGADARSTES
jgi:hypothetical protein